MLCSVLTLIPVDLMVFYWFSSEHNIPPVMTQHTTSREPQSLFFFHKKQHNIDH